MLRLLVVQARLAMCCREISLMTAPRLLLGVECCMTARCKCRGGTLEGGRVEVLPELRDVELRVAPT
jgi:hypothetical protein